MMQRPAQMSALVDAHQQPQYYNVEWPPDASCASGIYFCRIEVDDSSNPANRIVKTRKLVYMK